MTTNNDIELPLVRRISFNKLLERYDVMAKSDDLLMASKAKQILKAQEPYPELREGFTDISLLDTYKDAIYVILQDVFSDVLSQNEIKAISFPYSDVMFHPSDRFKKIIAAAGDSFKPVMRNQDEGINYIMSCVIILNFYYGFTFDFSRPYFYDIPDANGVMRHYKILYNADFMEIDPIGEPKKISQEDVDQVLENFHDLELWKKMIPPNSFISKGFVISNMFDVTADHSISAIKSELIASDKHGNDNFMLTLQETFKSFFRLPGLRVGFVTYNTKEDKFERVYDKGVKSFILNTKDTEFCDEALCQKSYKKLIADNDYFVISDVDKYDKLLEGKAPYGSLKKQGIKSAIFAPIAKNEGLLGVLEIVSKKKNNLNSVNATKLLDIMPYIEAAVLRSKVEEENMIDAVIQNECTAIHSSVYWRFKEEAKQFIRNKIEGRDTAFKKIEFKNVYPLYGQVDIKDSSQARNKAIQRDLIIQLSEIKKILKKTLKKSALPIYEELMYRVGNHIDTIKEVLHTSSEQAIFNFVREEVNPIFEHLKTLDSDFYEMISNYEESIDSETESYYDHRRNYDKSVLLINEKLAAVIDKKQEDAQHMYPHLFERYKTDGIEHNMYIGETISEDRGFNMLYLNNLRLWQLQVMCDMENAYYHLKPQLPIALDVASLILVHNTSLAIRFRMDEKQFDVDGTYNARYEIIKKRIDKSFVKGTNERLTQKGKIAIVYSQKKDELEYLRYITFLRSKGYFTKNIEILELEGLQGVSGLKAIRVEILYTKEAEMDKTYTYEDLMKELNV